MFKQRILKKKLHVRTQNLQKEYEKIKEYFCLPVDHVINILQQQPEKPFMYSENEASSSTANEETVPPETVPQVSKDVKTRGGKVGPRRKVKEGIIYTDDQEHDACKF